MSATTTHVLPAPEAATEGSAHGLRPAARTLYLLAGLLAFAVAVQLGGWTWLLLL